MSYTAILLAMILLAFSWLSILLFSLSGRLSHVYRHDATFRARCAFSQTPQHASDAAARATILRWLVALLRPPGFIRPADFDIFAFRDCDIDSGRRFDDY